MTEAESDRMVTDIHTRNVIALLKSVLASSDPSSRAQYLAEAQQELGWAQRRVVDECQRQNLSWRQIAESLGLAHDALYRQHASGGPVVTVSPYYRKESRNMKIVPQLVVAFRTVDDGKLHVFTEANVRNLASFTMSFNPAGPSPYAARDLQYYYQDALGLAIADLGRSAGYTLRPEGFGRAFCITEEVMDELFGPPFIGSSERKRWEASLQERSAQRG
jgi:hypothetical protein